MKLMFIAMTILCMAACTTMSGSPTPSGEVVSGEHAGVLSMGKRTYEVHCVRCHGPDGKDETYPFIARLDGIGGRMTPEEILEATWASGFVSPRSMNEDERHALGQYVATL
jgi:mono/diheme cytochrome c family protein